MRRPAAFVLPILGLSACTPLTAYRQSLFMPLAEPPEVTALIHLLREGGLIHGCSLTGAGGGGFMVLVCRSAGGGRREVEALLRRNPQLQRHDFRTHACAVDPHGLVLAVTHGAAPGAASHLEP